MIYSAILAVRISIINLWRAQQRTPVIYSSILAVRISIINLWLAQQPTPVIYSAILAVRFSIITYEEPQGADSLPPSSPCSEDR